MSPSMATPRQCTCSSVSPFTQLAKAFSLSSSLPLITFMHLISLLLFAFLSLAHSHSTEPSSYSSVAASSSADSLLMHAHFPQKKEALPGQIHASRDEPPISTPAFIYESVAASFSSRPRAEGSHLHDKPPPQNAEAALLDHGGKHLSSVAYMPSFIYESVATSLSQKAHGSTLLRENAPQEENAFLLDYGIGKPIMKKEVAKPSYIYESLIAALIPSRPPNDGRRILRDNVPQEDINAFLLVDGTNNPIRQKKEDPIIANPSFIYESVAASIHSEVHDAVIRNNVPQEDDGFLLDDGGKHVDKLEKGDKTITGKQFIYEYVAAQSHIASHVAGGNLLGDNVPQPDNVLLLDDGGKHVHESPAAAAASTEDGGELLQDNVPQEQYAFLRDDGRKMPIPSSHHDGNNKVLLIDTKDKQVKSQTLHDIDVKKSLNVQENKSPAKAAPSLLHDNVPQGKHAFLVDDGSIKHVEHDSPVASLKEGYPAKEEISLRMVVGDSSNNMIQTGYKVQGNPSNEENLRMVVGDSSKSLVQEGYASPPKLEDNLRMVADDTSNNMIKKLGPFGGRSRSCTPHPQVCDQLADAKYMNHIALYGEPLRATSEKKPACCGGICVDLNTNHLNCGRCGKACTLLQTCCSGKCTDLKTDSSNCGQCGHCCPSNTPCQFGMCGYY